MCWFVQVLQISRRSVITPVPPGLKRGMTAQLMILVSLRGKGSYGTRQSSMQHRPRPRLHRPVRAVRPWRSHRTPMRLTWICGDRWEPAVSAFSSRICTTFCTSHCLHIAHLLVEKPAWRNTIFIEYELLLLSGCLWFNFKPVYLGDVAKRLVNIAFYTNDFPVPKIGSTVL